jgi:8-oxo-dGTP pyrophosphatase MutT (NUDIX family)
MSDRLSSTQAQSGSWPTTSSRCTWLDSHARRWGSPLLEIPAGTLDVEGESKLECAKRELCEEAGLRATNWSLLRSFYPAPGWGDVTTTLFLASGLRQVDAEPIPGEEIAILAWPLSDLDGAMNEAKDAKTLIALLLLRDLLNPTEPSR